EPGFVHSLMVVDVGNPSAPAEVRRLGNSSRIGVRLSKAPGLSTLHALSYNSAAGAIEEWGLSDPANPSLLVVNATLDGGQVSESQDDLRATDGVICYLQWQTNSLMLFDPVSLTRTSLITRSPTEDVVQLGTDPPNAFITRTSGELVRVNIGASP